MSFKRLDPQDFLVSADSVTTSCWSGNSVTLSTFFTSSTQTNSTSGDYYYDVYQADPDSSDTAAVQFAIAYGDSEGSGSVYFNDNVSYVSPSRTVYGQYRNLILGDEEVDFTYGTGNNTYTGKNFYALSIDRSRFKEKLAPGSFELKLSGSSGAGITLTDNSSTVSVDTFTDAGRVYELKSNVSESVSNSGSYGKLLPDVGIVLLNAAALDATETDGGIALGTGRSSDTADDNNTKLYDAITSASSFKLRSNETISSNFVFIRARNSEFNYTTNPSFLTGSGELRDSNLIESPQVYITAVGLYNDNNDLLAVAKLSRPLLKDFTKESLVRVKLDY